MLISTQIINLNNGLNKIGFIQRSKRSQINPYEGVGEF